MSASGASRRDSAAKRGLKRAGDRVQAVHTLGVAGGRDVGQAIVVHVERGRHRRPPVHPGCKTTRREAP
jgi:hypothetical protein